MAQVTRATGTPYVDGDVLPGARLESDISRIVTAINGGLDSTNLADGAVTAAKLASAAVTEAKIVDGACGKVTTATPASVVMTGNGTSTVASVTHSVGLLGHAIVITFSCSMTLTSAVTLSLECDKDGTSLLGAGVKEQIQIDTSASAYTVSRTWIDASPTAGGTHTYDVKITHSASGATASYPTLASIELRR